MRAWSTFIFVVLQLALHAQQWNWAASAGGGGNVDLCFDIATDSQGNAYWVGSASGDVDFGCGTLNTGASDILGFVAKRAPDGTCVWVRGITTTLFEAWTYGIAIDAEDRIYITGSFEGNADFGSGVTLNGFSGDDIFLARYDTAGTCLWARRGGGNSNDEARGLDVSAAGDVFLAGTCGGTSFNFDGITIANPGNFKQLVVARYDSTGTLHWVKSSMGNGQGKSARAISVANDRLYVTGQVGFSAATFDGIALTPGAQGSYLYVLASDLDGNAVWARSYGRGDHEGMGISADTLGNVFVAGRMWGDLELPTDTMTSVSSNDDILVMKLDREGVLHWARSTGSSARDLAWGVTVDGMGNAYFASHFLQTIDYFGTSVTALGGEDALISKIDGQGNVVWVARPSGYQRDVPLCIHRNSMAPYELYFGGYYWGPITYGNTTIDDVLNGDAMIVAGVDTTFHVSSYATSAGCPGACDGTAYAFAHGDGPFTYAWVNGANSASISGLCPGEYIVAVTDTNGVVRMDTVMIMERSDPGFTLQQDGDLLWVDGGEAWQWFHDGAVMESDSASLVAEATGEYHAQVTDAFGCVWSTDTIMVIHTGSDGPSVAIAFTAFPNPARDGLTVNYAGSTMVVVQLLNSAAQVIARQHLVPGPNHLALTGLPAGLYLLRATDGSGVRIVVQ